MCYKRSGKNMHNAQNVGQRHSALRQAFNPSVLPAWIIPIVIELLAAALLIVYADSAMRYGGMLGIPGTEELQAKLSARSAASLSSAIVLYLVCVTWLRFYAAKFWTRLRSVGISVLITLLCGIGCFVLVATIHASSDYSPRWLVELVDRRASMLRGR